MKYLLIIAGVVAVGAVGAAVFLGQSDTESSATGNTDTNSYQENNEKLTGTFKDIILSGKSYSCSFSKKDAQGGESSGQVFVAKENMLRGEYHMVDLDGNAIDVEIIQDGEFNYMWGDSPMGYMAIKTKIKETDTTKNKEGNFIESDEEYDFDCSRWRVDEKMFVPPSDVTFSEFITPDYDIPKNLLNAQNGGAGTNDICKSCDTAPDEASKAQCLQALSTFGC